MIQRYFTIHLLGLFLLMTSAQADNWPQFRGSNFDAVAQSDCPTEWDLDTNIRWKVEIPGEGWSCPIVWSEKVFVTVAVITDGKAPDDEDYRRRNRGGDERPQATYRWDVLCLHAKTGEVLWRKSPKTGRPPMPRHSSNTYATETMVTDGQHVYAYFGMNGLFCYDMEGNLQWQKDLGNYKMRAGWGTASSPILHDGHLFLQIDNEEQSFIVSLDGKTGEEIWRQDRNEPSSYGSPIIWKNSLRTELIAGGQVYRSYDPESGELLWSLDMEKGRNSATPLAVGDHLYVGNELRNRGGSDDGGGFLFSVKAGGEGDITGSNSIQWKVAKSGIQMASPVFCNGHLYLLERRSGILNCINAETGESAYHERIKGARAFWSSPWVCGDHVFCLDDTGTTHVLASGPKLQVLKTNPLEELCWSSPAIADGAIFIRTANHLYCIAEK